MHHNPLSQGWTDVIQIKLESRTGALPTKRVDYICKISDFLHIPQWFQVLHLSAEGTIFTYLKTIKLNQNADILQLHH
jgi:hypothetical protein